MTPKHFIDDELRIIRREFYPVEKKFYQDRRDLIAAITWPARWLNERGVKAPASMYRKILQTVIAGVKRHANRARIRHFGLYFLHTVQEHMRHHGDAYYYNAKAARPIGSLLPAATSRISRTSAEAARVAQDRTTELLAEIGSIVRSPGGRHRRRDSVQADLLPTFPPRKGGKSREAP